MKISNHKIRRVALRCISAALIAALVLSVLTACGSSGARGTVTLGDEGISPSAGTDLTASAELKEVTTREADDSFVKASADFAIKLMQESEDDGSYMISPLSVMMALSMTANGADKETLAQMQDVLADGMDIADLDEYLASYFSRLCSENKDAYFSMADSVWVREDKDLKVNEDFLSACRSYFGAQVMEAPFDASTLKAINKWTEDSTGGMIDKILDKISKDAMLYLINAIAFDAEWEDIYREDQVWDGDFKTIDKKRQDAKYMWSSENAYIEQDGAKGFIKPYKGGTFSFVGILPPEDVDPNEYIASLSGEKYLSLINSKKETEVTAGLPKFKKEFSLQLKDILPAMGMKDAFDADKADFTKIGQGPEGLGFYISSVIHKTFIDVDEKGTRAGAATAVEMTVGSAMDEEIKEVWLNRPFVYAIIETETGVPVFLGTVTEL